MLGLTPFSYLPKVIRHLLLANLAVFVIGFIAIKTRNPLLWNVIGFLPADKYAIVNQFQFWRVFTYMFTHFELWHFAANMIGLWSIGPTIYRHLGSKDFLKLYFGSGVFAILVSLPFYGSAVGASGALFGLFYAFAYYYPNAQVLFMFVIPVRAQKLLWGSVIASVVMGLTGIMGVVAHFTHVGGVLGALLFFKYFFGKGQWTSTTKNWNQWQKKRSKETTVEHVAQKANASDERFYEENERLDMILKKISRYGIEGLEEEERLYLEECSKKEQLRKGKQVSIEEWKKRKEQND